MTFKVTVKSFVASEGADTVPFAPLLILIVYVLEGSYVVHVPPIVDQPESRIKRFLPSVGIVRFLE